MRVKEILSDQKKRSKVLLFLESIDRRQKLKIVFLVFAIIIGGFLETIGVAAIIPFMAIISDPNFLQKYLYLLFLYEKFNFQSIDNFKIFVGSCVFLAMMLSIASTAFITFLQVNFIHNSTKALSQRLFRGYIHQQYDWFLKRNSSNLTNTLNKEVENIVTGLFMPAITLFSNAVGMMFLIITLLLVSPIATISIALFSGCTYVLIYKYSRISMKLIGGEKVNSQKEKSQILSETFESIKEIKANSLESLCIERFDDSATKLAKALIGEQMHSQLPRYMLEAIAFGGMMGMVLVGMILGEREIAGLLPILGLFALAAYRLMPKLHNLYVDASKIKIGNYLLSSFEKDAGLYLKIPKTRENNYICFKNSIEFKDVSYRYSGSEKNALTRINFTIHKGESIGIVGRSGSGKTTLVDIILGLLRPIEGEIILDGKVLSFKEICELSRSISYVPQSNFVADDTVVGNIAFGIKKDKVDLGLIKRSAKIAGIDDFIESLEGGYSASTGERGSRLSGGQRQRIGIARGVYRQAPILILDEATSALDKITETRVLENIASSCEASTILTITHKIETLKRCTSIYLLEDGHLIAAGTYDSLRLNCEKFRNFVPE